MKYNYQTMSYEPQELIALIEDKNITPKTKLWARLELQLNGWSDTSPADNL